MDLAKYIRDIPDYPKKGIMFKDIMPLCENGEAFRHAIKELADIFKDVKADAIVAAEARGFIFGAALAYKLKLGFVAVRKPGKLPYRQRRVTYELEYGQDSLCIHEDALKPGMKAIVIDDLLATGGTVCAMCKLVEEAGAKVAGIGFLIELDFLHGRDKLRNYRVESLLHYAGE